LKINVVCDIHGAVPELAQAANDSDLFICLGDLLLFTDYQSPANGIMGDLFGEEDAREWIHLRTTGRFPEARAFAEKKWASIDGDRRALIEARVRDQYRAVFELMPAPVQMTYGNVDLPNHLQDFLKPEQKVLDGEVLEFGGLRFGFVGGGLQSIYRTPQEVNPEEYARKVDALGPVDVLCTHIPPAIPQITYDVMARRMERGSDALLDYIEKFQPKFALFGHVHHPLYSQTRVGRTRCVNVGYFRDTKRPFVLEL
jgi:Icc-related predicted phosphoesterase